MSDIVLFERYKLTEIIGRGGQATVFRAIDLRFGVDRAIKILDRRFENRSKANERFGLEARAMAVVNHPKIITIFDTQMGGELSFIVMEYFPHGTLWDWVQQYGPLPSRCAVEVMIGVLNGLEVVHAKNIVHRDIKPTNLLISANGDVKLADFGIASVRDGQNMLTRTGSRLGTFGFASPEQRVNAKDIDLRADIFAVAATLICLVQGRPPDDLSLALEEPSLLRGIDPELRAAILPALNPDREFRYQNATSFSQALQNVLEHLPERPFPPLTSTQIEVESVEPDMFPSLVSTEMAGGITELSRYSAPSFQTLVGFSLLSLLLIVLFSRFGTEERVSVQPVNSSCTALAKILVEQQNSNGGFSGIPQSSPMLWDTAQQSMALMSSSSCGFTDNAWTSLALQFVEQALDDPEQTSNGVALAWTALFLGRLPETDRLRSKVDDHLERLKLPSGAYRSSLQAKEQDNPYITTLLLWSMLEQSFDGKAEIRSEVPSDGLIRAFHRLNMSLDNDSRIGLGLHAQILWVLYEVEEFFPQLQVPHRHQARFLKLLETSCLPEKGSCTQEKLAIDSFAMKLGEELAQVSIISVPWARLLVERIATKETDLELSMLINWLDRQYLSAPEQLFSVPGYILSEFLLTAAEMVNLESRVTDD